MKTSQSFGVFFTIKKEKAKDGKTVVYACVTVNKERCFVALKQVVEVNLWDFGKGNIKGNKEETKEANAYLEEVKLTLGNLYKEMQLGGKLITAQAIKSLFLGESDMEERYTLSRLMDYHFETASASLKWSTLKHYAVTRRYLEKFLKEKLQAADIYIHEIDYKFIIDFETFLRNHKPETDHQKAMNNNGVMKHLIRLRKMTTLALKLTWIAKDPFKNYKFRYKKVETAFLTQAELKAIQNKEFVVDRLNMVRDLFVFSCYTGLSFVDLMNLQETNITIGEDGDQWIKLFRQKSNEPTNIPILPTAQIILDLYRNCPRSRVTATLFPRISNQKVNSYLKEIGIRNDIKKVLTFGVARHTFATTITLSNNVPIETVSKMMGHTKIATTQIYARVLLKKISDDMGKLKKIMEQGRATSEQE
jgi:integrase